MAAVVWLLAVCCGAILSSSDAWRPKQEFEFSVSGRSALRLPSVSKFVTGIHYRGRLLVQTHAARMLVIKMVNMSYTNFHLELPEGAWQELPFTSDESHSLSLSDEVFIVSLQSSGLINSMTVNSQLSENDVNFLQGIASQFQFDLMGVTAEQTKSTNSIHGRGDYSQPADFRIMEESVAGICETRYEVNPSTPRESSSPSQARLCGNRPFVEVLKSRDYDRCSRAAEYHAGLPGHLGCTASSAQCAEVWSRAALTRVLGCGDRRDFLMLGSVASSKVVANLHLHNNSEAVMDSFVRLDLLEARPLSSRFSPPERSTTLNELRYLYSGAQQLNSGAPISMPTLGVELESQLETGFTRNVRQAAENMNKTHDSKLHHRKYSDKKKKSKKAPPTTASPPVTVTATATVATTSKNTPLDLLKPSRNLTQQAFTNYPERPFSAMFLAHRAPEDRACMVQQLKKHVSEIASELETPQVMPGKRTMEKVSLVVEICRTMTLPELQKAMENVMDVEGRDSNILTERKIFRDVVKMCGTVPAFELAKSWIETKKVTGQEACDIVATLPRTLLTPNVFLVQSFYDLVRSSVMRDDEQLKITSALSFTNLLRVACVKESERRSRFPATSPGTACTPEDAAHYLQWFKNQLKADPALREVYLFALGNSASPAAMASLKAAAVDKTYRAGVRATAVLAMRELLIRDANATVPTLLHLFQDPTQPLPVRMAAASLLVFARSSPVVWQRLALSTWFERSPAICAFVWSSLTTLAQTRDPVLKPMAQNAERVLLLAKPMRLGLHLPYNTVWTSVTTELRQVLLNHFSYSPIRDASHLYYRYIQRMAGISRGAFESEVWVSSPDDFLSLLYDFLHPSEDLSKVRPAQEGILYSTRWIHEKLKIAQRNMPRINGRLRFRYNGLQEQLFPFDRNGFFDLVKEGQALVKELQTGKHFHLQNINMDEMVMSTTTEMGFPLSFRLRRFWVGRTVGQAIINRLDSSFKFNASAMVSQQLMSELGFFVGWDNTQHVAASHALTVAQVPPLQVEAALRANSSRLVLSTEMLVPPSEPVPLLRHSTVPFTAQVDTLNLTPISLGRNTRLQFDVNHSGDQMLLGSAALTYKSEGAQNTLRSWLGNALSVFGQPMMWPTLHHGDVRVTLYPLPAVKLNISVGDAETIRGCFHLKNFPKRLLNHTAKDSSLIHGDTQLEGSLIKTTLRTTAVTLGGAHDHGTISGETTEQTTTEQSGITEEVTTVTEAALSLETSASTESTPDEATATPEATTTETTTDSPTTDTTPETTTTSVVTETSSEQSTTTTETSVEAVMTTVQDDQSMAPNLTTTDETQSPSHFHDDLLECTTEPVHNFPPLECEFNATELDPFSDDVNGSRVAYLLDRVLAGIPDGRSFAVEVNASIQTPSPTLFRAMLTLGESKNGSIFRKGFFLRSEAHTWQTFLTANLNVPSVPLMDALQLLETNLSTTLTADWVLQFNDTRFVILLKSNAVRSDKRTNYLKMSEDFEHCSMAVGASRHVSAACRSLAEAASTVSRYDTTLSYNYRILETLWNSLPSGSSRTRVVVELSDEERAMDLWVLAPSRNLEENIHTTLHPLVMSALRLNPTCSITDGFGFSAYCGLGGGHVRTYDGLEFEYALDSSWHLLTKDCSGKTRVAVLARFVNNMTELYVNVDNFRMLRVSDAEVVMDGHPVTTPTSFTDLAGTTIMRLVRGTDMALQISLPQHGLKVLYADSAVLLYSDLGTRGRLCGICGDNDGSAMGELRNPRGNVEKTPNLFAASYRIPNTTRIF